MKELVPMDSYGVFIDQRNTTRANSLIVAEMFGKRHDNVLRDIHELECSQKFILLNFEEIKYKDEKGRIQPCVSMTRDGFMFLVMGYRGKKAAALKEAYIARFNEMEALLKSLLSARQEFPLLTEQIKLLHDEPKAHHFSNECDMLNRIATGKSAKQLREAFGLHKGDSVRPHLPADQVKLLEILQKIDVGLLVSVPDFKERKRILQEYKSRWMLKSLRHVA